MVFAICIMVVHQYAAAHVIENERIHAVQQYRALKANGDVAKALFEKTAAFLRLYFTIPAASSKSSLLSSGFPLRILSICPCPIIE